MPMYALKSPDLYPSIFHNILEKGYRGCVSSKEEECTLTWPDDRFKTPNEARTEQNRFDAFRVNLKRHPLHRLHGAAKGCRIRCSVQEDFHFGGWYLKFTFKQWGRGIEEVLDALNQ